MNNNILKTIVVLVLGIALGVGGYFLVDKYIVDEEKNDANVNNEIINEEQKNNNNNSNTNESSEKLNSIVSIEQKMNEYANKSLTDIEKKYNLTRNLSLVVDENNNVTGLAFNYKMNNQNIEPIMTICDKTSSLFISVSDVKKMIENDDYNQITDLRYNYYLHLEELKNANNENYISIGADIFYNDDINYYVYYLASTPIKIGTMISKPNCTCKGGCYEEVFEGYILDEVDKSIQGDSANIHFRDKNVYTVTYDSFSKKYLVNNYTINGNGQYASLTRNIVKSFDEEGIYNCPCK